jgi:hypothetical protein
MYLTVILGLLALTNYSSVAAVLRVQSLALVQENPAPSDAPTAGPAQEPAPSVQPASPEQEQKSEPTKSEQATPKATPSTDATTPAQPGQPDASKVAAKKRRRRKPVAATTTTTPEKKVVRNGGTADAGTQLSPGVSDEQASRERQTTSQLLSSTDVNLKQLSARQLNTTQQDSVSQIKKYMEQAKAAEAAGDVQRAQNLASKALMLSDDLVKH